MIFSLVFKCSIVFLLKNAFLEFPLGAFLDVLGRFGFWMTSKQARHEDFRGGSCSFFCFLPKVFFVAGCWGQ